MADSRGERLQKLLAHAGVASRRAAEDLIREGRVTVNGQVAELGQRADFDTDAIKVDGRRIQPPDRYRYLLVNKPTGVVSTVDDPEGRPTVLELVPESMRRGLAPVGRLDFDSEGLMLLTDDGDLAHHVAHPRYGCHKTYEVKVKGRPSAAAIDTLRDGIVFDRKRTAPAHIEPFVPKTGSGARESVSNSWWRVVLGEGRNRQIREMFFRIGHPVNRLRRVAVGPLRDPYLPPGGWRELTSDEVDALRQATKTVKKKPVRKKPEEKAAGKKAAKQGATRPDKGSPPRPRRGRRDDGGEAPPSPYGRRKGPPEKKGRPGGQGSVRSGRGRSGRGRPSGRPGGKPGGGKGGGGRRG